MKKILLSAFVAAVAMGGVFAQSHTWDFTQWSEETVANLKADAAASGLTGWSDVEKRDSVGKVWDNPAADNCFWLTDSESTAHELTANGAPIQELAGLLFSGNYPGNRSLAIAVNYPSTSLGTYAGPAYLWLGGGNQSDVTKRLVCFTIPNVKVGSELTMQVESHKPTDSRGVQLYAGSIAAGNEIGEAFTPTTLASNTWTITGEGEVVDVVVYNTNGCHIYSITAELGEAVETPEPEIPTAPVVTLEENAGNTVITLTTEVGEVYFNFSGATTTDKSQRYTEPITLTEPATIYAFSAASGEVSELVEQAIEIEGWTDRDNLLTHFHADKAVYGDKAITLIDKDATGEDDQTEGWLIKSDGQKVGFEKDGKQAGVGNGAAGRFADEAIDEIGTTTTAGFISFNDASSEGEYSARIETAEKYAAPLDVVVFAGNGNGNDKTFDVQVEISADGTEWTSIGSVKFSATQRYYKRTRLSYEGNDEVYVRVASHGGSTKAQIHDIYVYNNPDATTGIASAAAEGAVKSVRIYNLAGQQVEKAQGIVLVQTIYADGTTTTRRMVMK